jgi:hypothetical protein
MIRWEEDEESGEWRGFSGELVIATVARAPAGGKTKWLWEVKAVERPHGARNSGQRATGACRSPRSRRLLVALARRRRAQARHRAACGDVVNTARCAGAALK